MNSPVSPSLKMHWPGRKVRRKILSLKRPSTSSTGDGRSRAITEPSPSTRLGYMGIH